MLGSAPAFASVNNPQQCERACGNRNHPLLGLHGGRKDLPPAARNAFSLRNLAQKPSQLEGDDGKQDRER